MRYWQQKYNELFLSFVFAVVADACFIQDDEQVTREAFEVVLSPVKPAQHYKYTLKLWVVLVGSEDCAKVGLRFSG